MTEQLLSITAQLTQLRIQVAQERNQRRQLEIERDTHRPLSIGDRVRITNNYQNLQGTIGRIIRVNNRFVTLRTDDGREIVRGVNNVQRVQDQHQHSLS